MPEVPKRLKPRPNTLRTLFVHSGNQCAFPSCTHRLVNQHDQFIAQVCHIRAAEKGGERFDETMDNTQRRAPENLILLCYEHHVETNDVKRFPVKKLVEMKADHERRFRDNDFDPGRVVLERAAGSVYESSIVDLTRLVVAKEPRTLERWSSEMDGQPADPSTVPTNLKTLRGAIEQLRPLPPDTRGLFSVIVGRAKRKHASFGVSFFEVAQATDTVHDQDEMRGHLELLRDAGFIDYFEIEEERGYWLEVRPISDGWQFWEELRSFAEKIQAGLDDFVLRLRFDALD